MLIIAHPTTHFLNPNCPHHFTNYTLFTNLVQYLIAIRHMMSVPLYPIYLVTAPNYLNSLSSQISVHLYGSSICPSSHFPSHFGNWWSWWSSCWCLYCSLHILLWRFRSIELFNFLCICEDSIPSILGYVHTLRLISHLFSFATLSWPYYRRHKLYKSSHLLLLRFPSMWTVLLYVYEHPQSPLTFIFILHSFVTLLILFMTYCNAPSPY